MRVSAVALQWTTVATLSHHQYKFCEWCKLPTVQLFNWPYISVICVCCHVGCGWHYWVLGNTVNLHT